MVFDLGLNMQYSKWNVQNMFPLCMIKFGTDDGCTIKTSEKN